MVYKSKYIETSPMAQKWKDGGWDEKSFSSAVETLEMMPREELIEICRELGLRFTASDWEKTTSEEQIILAILGDYRAEEISRVLGISKQ